jgi:hypothetical protein
MENIRIVERKDLSDLLHSFTAERTMFIHRHRLMAEVPHRLARDRRSLEPSK